MKKLLLFLMIAFLPNMALNAYQQQPAAQQVIEKSLQRAAEILNRSSSGELWNTTLNAPILIVDNLKNKIYITAIEDGKVHAIQEDRWDRKVPLANSFFEYNGKKYVTVIYNSLINASPEEQANLLIHEIFHFYQEKLGIPTVSSNNSQMDKPEGRSLLRMEMQALRQVLGGNINSLTDALAIRDYRQKLYPDNNEDMYELNEGLANYTGIRLSMSNVDKYINDKLVYDISRGYTNAFGYLTGSGYAAILDKIYPLWKQDEQLKKGMIYLIKKSNPQYVPSSNHQVLDKIMERYDYNRMLAEEKEELKSFGDISQFEALLKDDAQRLSIPVQNINLTYNPNDRVIALSGAVLLKNMTLTGEWGRITIRNGVVRMNNWSAFYLLPPKKIDANIAEGDDYKIELNEGWEIVKEGLAYAILKKK